MALALMGPGGGGNKITAKMIKAFQSTRGITPYLFYDKYNCTLGCNYTSSNATAYIELDFTYLKKISYSVGYFVNNGGYGNRTGITWIGDSYENYDSTLYKQNVTIKNAPDGVCWKIDSPQSVSIDVTEMTGKHYLCLQAPGISGVAGGTGASNNVFIMDLKLEFDV